METIKVNIEWIEKNFCAALSRVTGINQRLLSHYANGLRNPRPAQRQRIVDGVHEIGRELLSVC